MSLASVCLGVPHRGKTFRWPSRKPPRVLSLLGEQTTYRTAMGAPRCVCLELLPARAREFRAPPPWAQGPALERESARTMLAGCGVFEVGDGATPRDIDADAPEVEAVCANHPFRLHQKQQHIREIHQQERLQLDGLISPAQRER